MTRSIIVPVKLDEKTFKRFTRFDMFRLRKRWVRPVVFMAILLAFALVALISRRPESGMIAAVLMVVGLGLPLVYFGTYLSQVNAAALNQRLGKGRRVYTVTLDEDGVRVKNDRKQENVLFVPWKEVRAAYKLRGFVCLYVATTRAFLLPDGQANASDEAVWEMIQTHINK